MKTVSIVLPLYNAAGFLPQVIPPLKDTVARGEAMELIVVDDGSTDDGPQWCRDHGLAVVDSGGVGLGPGAARNRGVERARGDLVLFVDSDVVIYPSVVSRVRAVFETERGLAAVLGSYDDRPPDRGLVSQYVNIRHHFVHQNGDREAATFWAGCGAVDRQAFLDVGGFDTVLFSQPAIEDIELGYRLRARGHRIILDKEMLCTHLKRWTLGLMIVTDVWRRAIPWARLKPDRRTGGSLNVSRAEFLKAGLSGLLSIACLAGVFYWPLLCVAAGILILVVAVNWKFFALIKRHNGWIHAIAGVVLHQLYYHYAVIAYLYCQLEGRLRPAGSTR